MRPLSYLIVLFVLPLFSIAQTNPNCKDSLSQPDPFYRFCGTDYEPVCGCDNVTYRNPCAAQYWGGLLNNGFNQGFTSNTVCGIFDYDIYPTAFGANLYMMNLAFFTKMTGSVYVYIYDPYGKLQFQRDYFIPVAYQKVDQQPIDLSFLKRGIYEFIVLFNGEKKSTKIAMLKYD